LFNSFQSEWKAKLDHHKLEFQHQETRLKEAAATQQDHLVELCRLRSEEEQHLRRIKDGNKFTHQSGC